MRLFLYKYGRIFEAIGALCLPVVIFLLEIDERKAPFTEWPKFVIGHVKWVKDHSFWIVLFLALFVLLGLAARQLCDPWLRDTLSFILEKYQDRAFQRGEEDPSHYHRVTIFKRKKFSLRVSRGVGPWFWPFGKAAKPWSGWMKPYLRSGHTTQKTKAVFLAPDDPQLAEGLAGRAWAGNRVLIKYDLPNLNIPNPASSTIERYARETFCPVDMINHMVQQRRQIARSLAAIPLEVNGRIWGVVVLDSLSPNGVSRDSAVDFRMTITLIGRLLERA